ncbi:DeoR/GlpR family DNA-binding transcription regulator, partial [Mitsuokella jalaludinii]
TGGTMRESSCALTGTIASQTLEKYYVDFTFISCKGIDREKGIMESNDSEGRIKSVMIRQARKAVLLIDHSKFDRTAFVKCDDFSHIDTLVTDEKPSSEWQSYLADNHINLIF